MKPLVVGLGIAGMLYCALMAVAYFGQRSPIYPVPGIATEPEVPGARLLTIGCAQLGTVHAVYAPAPAGAPTLVHFHGNGEQLSDQAGLVGAFATAGLGVLAVEYPGYGLDREAQANEPNLYTAAECALEHLQTTLGVPLTQTVVQGQSLGSGVAVEMARRRHAAGLVLISPYTSMVEVAGLVAPFLPVGPLTRDRFDSLSKVDTVTAPALVIHGTADEVIPFEMGQRIAHTLQQGTLRPIEGAHHNDLFARHRPRVVATIVEFAMRACVR